VVLEMMEYPRAQMSAIADLVRFISAHPLTKNACARALARMVMWQIRSRIQSEVVVPWVANQKLVVRRGMTGATGNIYVGLQEFADMMFALHFLRDGDLFLDIGANVGTYAVLASGVCKATTWAFEPDPGAAHDLRRNIEINGLQGLVAVHEVVLSAIDGEIAFTIGRDTVNRVANAGEPSRVLHQKPLDSIVGTANPIFAKLDVEGYEEEVLRGAQGLLSNGSLQAIALETITACSGEMLSKNRFARVFYDPFERLLSTDPVGITSSNALFVRDVSFAQDRLKQSPAIRVLDALI
jgi:FkbM family methyltransferase